jgi:hypothetical protein
MQAKRHITQKSLPTQAHGIYAGLICGKYLGSIFAADQARLP